MKPDEWKAFTWLRNSAQGRSVRVMLEGKLAEARRVYESQPATEDQRQLVLAYKDALDVLFVKPLEHLE